MQFIQLLTVDGLLYTKVAIKFLLESLQLIQENLCLVLRERNVSQPSWQVSPKLSVGRSIKEKIKIKK